MLPCICIDFASTKCISKYTIHCNNVYKTYERPTTSSLSNLFPSKENNAQGHTYSIFKKLKNKKIRNGLFFTDKTELPDISWVR